MSWIAGDIVMNSYTEKEIKKAQGLIRSRVRHEADLEEFPHMGDYLNPIKKMEDETIFPSYEAAEEYLDKIRGKWSRKYNPVVAFQSGEIKIPNNIKRLEERAEEEAKKYVEYKKSHSIKNFTAKYIGCQKCGSKVNKEYIKYDFCPVCNADLRSKTTIKTLQRYMDKKNSLLKEYNAAKKKIKAKGPIKYLLMYEEYVG